MIPPSVKTKVNGCRALSARPPAHVNARVRLKSAHGRAFFQQCTRAKRAFLTALTKTFYARSARDYPFRDLSPPLETFWLRPCPLIECEG